MRKLILPGGAVTAGGRIREDDALGAVAGKPVLSPHPGSVSAVMPPRDGLAGERLAMVAPYADQQV